MKYQIQAFMKPKKKFTVSSYKELFLKISPDIIIIFAHRLPDIAVLNAAKECSIPTVYYQHGLYIPFMKRVLSLYINNIVKTFKYFSYALSIGANNRIGRISTLKSFIEINIFGKNIRSTNLELNKITADSCLVYGDHWVDYHIKEYGYTKEKVKIVGAPDLDGINFKNISLIQNNSSSISYCYIAQTLVEDGRLARSSMEIYLKNLASVINNYGDKLLIKLHPRSDQTLYKDLDCNKEFCKDFPEANIYIGHYSTILIRGLAYTNKYLLVDFDGHVIPSYLEMLASERVRYDNFLELKRLLKILRNQSLDSDDLIRKRKKLLTYFDTSGKKFFRKSCF